MKNKIKKLSFKASLVLSSALASGVMCTTGPAQAGQVAGNATEITQILNNAQLLQQSVAQAQQIANEIAQITNQIQQIQFALQSYENMVTNTLGIPEQIWRDIEGELLELRDLTMRGNALGYQLGNLDEMFRDLYKPSGEYRIDERALLSNVREDYRAWAKQGMETIEAASASVSMNMADIEDENKFLARIRSENNSTGRSQLLQTGNRVASEQVAQMQKLRAIGASTFNLIAAEQARALAEKAAAQTLHDRYYGSELVATDNGSELGGDRIR